MPSPIPPGNLPPELQRLAEELAQQAQPDQLAWLGGYFTGLAGAGGVAASPAPSPGRTLTILFGSQTGNSEGIANDALARARERGIPAVVKDMNDYKTATLRKETDMMVVISTHGEGDPPDTAIEFFEFLQGKRAPKLDELGYTVLALGDSSYEFFCKTGQDLDERFEALGAERISPRIDCDVDYEDAAARWIDDALNAFAPRLESAEAPAVTVLPAAAAPAQPAFDKKHPFDATLLERILLNGRGSAKETFHLELSIEGSGLTYEPGDSLGVYATNSPREVERILETTGYAGDERVQTHAGVVPLWEALTRLYEITTLTRPFLQSFAEAMEAADLAALLEPEKREELNAYLYGRHIHDVLRANPVNGMPPQDFIQFLRKMPARLYSIASSLEAHPDEVHLTVGATRYHSHHFDRDGVCSTYLADRTDEEHPIPVYVDANKNFRLPLDASRPIIMIGPGTGIAPFRAFVEERELQGAEGKSWLFFGDQHFTTDFLYQAEWQNFLKAGVLTRMDVAFSRDQAHKVYVQHRMLEHGRDFFAWLEEGAHLYVCGDESRMAHDVDEALLNIIEQEGARSREQAEEYVKALKKEKRYQRDVY